MEALHLTEMIWKWEKKYSPEWRGNRDVIFKKTNGKQRYYISQKTNGKSEKLHSRKLMGNRGVALQKRTGNRGVDFNKDAGK